MFSWGNSSRGRLGHEASSDDEACSSLVSFAGDISEAGDDDGRSQQLQVTSLCSSHSRSIVCLMQRKSPIILYCCEHNQHQPCRLWSCDVP